MDKKNRFSKEIILLLASFTVFCCLFLPNNCFSEDNSNYILGPGDTIEISVWNHPELKKELSVRPDGWVSFPLAGEVLASGEKPGALSAKIRDKLLTYIKNPEVSVIVLQYKSKHILILGQVKKPGLYQYEGGMTVFDAIGIAEGYNKHAELKSILVVRNAFSEKPQFYLANLHETIHEGYGQKDIELMPKDIVYVPQNFIGNLGDFMDYFLTRIQPSAQSYQAVK